MHVVSRVYSKLVNNGVQLMYMENISRTTATNEIHQFIEAEGAQLPSENSDSMVNTSRSMLVGIILLCIVMLGSVAVYALQKKTDEVQPASLSKVATQPLEEAQVVEYPEYTVFKHNNFEMQYLSGWIVSDLQQDENFPLKERLQTLYEAQNAIAFSKNDTYLIITLEAAPESA